MKSRSETDAAGDDPVRRAGDAHSRRHRSLAQADGADRLASDRLAHHEDLRRLWRGRFILCLGFKREAFVDYFLNYRSRNSDITVSLGPNGT